MLISTPLINFRQGLEPPDPPFLQVPVLYVNCVTDTPRQKVALCLLIREANHG